MTASLTKLVVLVALAAVVLSAAPPRHTRERELAHRHLGHSAKPNVEAKHLNDLLTPKREASKKHKGATTPQAGALDLEALLDDEVVKSAAETNSVSVTNEVESVISEVASLEENLEKVKGQMNDLKKKLEDSKTEEAKVEAKEEDDKVEAKEEDDKVEAKEEAKVEAKQALDEFKAESVDDMNLERDVEDDDEDDDEDDIALIQMQGVDEMNGGMEDDDSSAPQLTANMMNRHAKNPRKAAITTVLAQHTHRASDDEGHTITVSGDGSGNTYDVAADGSRIPNPVPAVEDDMQKPNDAAYRVNKGDPDMAGVEIVNVDSELVMAPMGMPGTTGKGLSRQEEEALEVKDEDMRCVCKRQGAPRGHDRVRCKKHPSPSPSPPPAPTKGIRQCAPGQWVNGTETGQNDTLCVYFPAKIEAPPPMPEEPEYPPECYDERNEWVEDETERKKWRFHAEQDKEEMETMLMQEGFHACGCNE